LTDNSVSNNNSLSDTIFLGFRIGMTTHEFDKHKQMLLLKKKLKPSSKGLLYQIEYSLGGSFFGHELTDSIWTENGVVLPEFFQDTLTSIEIRFLNINSHIYYNLLPKLDQKYYESKKEFANFFGTNKQTDTLSIGNSINASVSNKWSIGDINISLRCEYVMHKIADKKVKRTENVILKYSSGYYYNRKQDKKADGERKRYDDVIKDL